MIASANVLNRPTAPTLSEGHQHAPLTFDERARELGLMLHEGHIPTVAEIQQVAGTMRQGMVYSYDRGDVGRRYLGPDGEEIEATAAQTLIQTASPWRWVRPTKDEHLLFRAAQALRQEGVRAGQPQTMSDYFRRHPKENARESVVLRAYEVVNALAPYGMQLDTENLDRLVALSRFSRNQLAEQGINADRILAERSKVKATATAPVQVHDAEQSVKPVWSLEPDKTEVRVSTPGTYTPGRATVTNTQTGKPAEYAKLLSEQGRTPNDERAETLAGLLRIKSVEPDTIAIAKSMYPREMLRGSTVTNRPLFVIGRNGFDSRAERRAHLKPQRADLSALNLDQKANVEAVTVQLRALRQTERAVDRGGEVPDSAAIKGILYPNKETLTPLEQQVVATAKAKLDYLALEAERRVPKSKQLKAELRQQSDELKAELRQRRENVGRWIAQVRQEYRTFTEKATPKAVRVARFAGAVASSLVATQAFLPVSKSWIYPNEHR